MKKKILIISLTVAVLAIAVIGGTLAWFTDTKSTTNTFVVGDVEISLTEPQWTAAGATQALNIVPSREISKDPTVENIGDNDCYVRLKVALPDAEYAVFEDYLDTLIQDVNGAWFSDSSWTDGGTEHYIYFYYGSNAGGTENYTIMKPTDDASTVFTSVKIPDALAEGAFNALPTNTDGNKEFVMNITAEAIQSEGTTTVEDSNPWNRF